MTVCNVVVIVLDWFADSNVLRFVILLDRILIKRFFSFLGSEFQKLVLIEKALT